MTQSKDHEPPWSAFYTALGVFGPAYLVGVHNWYSASIDFEARESDAFFSEHLQMVFVEEWKANPERAIREGLDAWLWNVQCRLRGLVGPDSLIPFDEWGVTPTLRAEIEASIEQIRFRNRKKLAATLLKVVSEGNLETPSAKLLLGAVVEPYGDTSEGQLIRAVAIPWRAIIGLLKRDWSAAYAIPPRKWEELIAAAFDRAGYDEVTLTPRSGDFGRDVIAVRKGLGSIRIIGSVKAYKAGHLVGHDDVRALAGVLHGDHKASKGIITTTSDFAPGIVKDPYLAPLMPFRLELVNGTRLRDWLYGLTR